jgi:hypothetical protein
MFPCNVIAQEAKGGGSEVAAFDPVASMRAIDNPEPTRLACRVRDLLKGIIARL